MPISLSGLDMSWLKNPENRLPKQAKKQRVRFDHARSELPSPRVMGDLNSAYADGGFKSPIDGEFITSRSQLRAHEKRFDVRQCGELTAEQQTRPLQESYDRSWAEINSDTGVDFTWTD